MCEEEDTCVRRRISIEIIMRRRIHVIDVGDVMIFDVAKSSSFRELQPHSRELQPHSHVILSLFLAFILCLFAPRYCFLCSLI
jgi:hypothetical protein